MKEETREEMIKKIESMTVTQALRYAAEELRNIDTRIIMDNKEYIVLDRESRNALVKLLDDIGKYMEI